VHYYFVQEKNVSQLGPGVSVYALAGKLVQFLIESGALDLYKAMEVSIFHQQAYHQLDEKFILMMVGWDPGVKPSLKGLVAGGS